MTIRPFILPINIGDHSRRTKPTASCEDSDDFAIPSRFADHSTLEHRTGARHIADVAGPASGVRRPSLNFLRVEAHSRRGDCNNHVVDTVGAPSDSEWRKPGERRDL